MKRHSIELGALPTATLLVWILSATGCDRGDASVDQGATAPAEVGQTPLPVAVEEVALGPIASYYRTTATLEVEKQARIVARAIGLVGEILVEEGDEVADGQPLLRLDNDEYRHRLEQAEASVRKLRSNHDRLREMVEQNLVSLEEYDIAANDLAVAVADEELARLNLDYTTVTAPFAGRITHRFVDPGQKIGLDTELFTIADFTPLLARVHVPSKEFKKIRPDQTVDLVLDSSGERLEGRITLVSPVIDPMTGTIKVTVEISDYPPGTRPGDFAEVHIVTERRESTTLVAKNAVITDKGEQIVFIAGADDRAERRVVEVGFFDDDHKEIVAGLDIGERVVVKGQRSLKHGSPLKVLEEHAAAPNAPTPAVLRGS